MPLSSADSPTAARKSATKVGLSGRSMTSSIAGSAWSAMSWAAIDARHTTAVPVVAEGEQGVDEQGGADQVDGEHLLPSRHRGGDAGGVDRPAEAAARDGQGGQAVDRGRVGDVHGHGFAAGGGAGELGGHGGDGVDVEVGQHEDVDGGGQAVARRPARCRSPRR